MAMGKVSLGVVEPLWSCVGLAFRGADPISNDGLWWAENYR